MSRYTNGQKRSRMAIMLKCNITDIKDKWVSCKYVSNCSRLNKIKTLITFCFKTVSSIKHYHISMCQLNGIDLV